MAVTRNGRGLGALLQFDGRDANYRLLDKRPNLFDNLPEEGEGELVHKISTEGLQEQRSEPHDVGFVWRYWLVTPPLHTVLGPEITTIYREAREFDDISPSVPGATLRGGAMCMRTRGYIGEFYWAASAAEVRAWFLSGGLPIVATLPWYEAMSEYRGEFVKVDGPFEGYHCVLLMGWSDRYNAVRVLNPHSRVWGANRTGRKWLRARDLARFIYEDAELCCPSDKRIGMDAHIRAAELANERAAAARTPGIIDRTQTYLAPRPLIPEWEDGEPIPTLSDAPVPLGSYYQPTSSYGQAPGKPMAPPSRKRRS